MIGLILAAGYGTRLRPITNEIPKPMVKVDGYPVLEHLVDHLKSFYIQKIIVNVHYKPEAIMGYFGDELMYMYEPELLGEERTIEALEPWLKNEYTIVMNGDTLTNIDIREMLRAGGGRNIRSMDGDTYTGTKILSPEYFDDDDNFVDYSHADTWWIDIGTPDRLKEARKFYEKNTD